MHGALDRRAVNLQGLSTVFTARLNDLTVPVPPKGERTGALNLGEVRFGSR